MTYGLPSSHPLCDYFGERAQPMVYADAAIFSNIIGISYENCAKGGINLRRA